MRPLTPQLARWLTHGEAYQALAGLRERPIDPHDTLPALTDLRTSYTEAEAAALLDQALLRQKAVDKFGELAARMLFTDEALQQASGLAIARYRSARYDGFQHVADLGCGIGGDSLGLARQAPRLLLIELDAIRLTFAEHNLRQARLATRVESALADWTTHPLVGVDAAFADPDRRPEGKRVFSLHESRPSLSEILAVQARLPNLGVKTLPGIDEAEIPPHCEVEWISDRGTLKEAVLWFGALRSDASRRATLLRDGTAATLTERALPDEPLPVDAPRQWLWEPDDAVIRASLVAAVGAALGATQIDAQIAYLSSDDWHDTPLARGWPVLQDGPFHLKTLNRWLRARPARVVAVKKRGSPVEPERFRRRLYSDPLGEPVTVFLTRHRDDPWMILCGDERRPA